MDAALRRQGARRDRIGYPRRLAEALQPAASLKALQRLGEGVAADAIMDCSDGTLNTELRGIRIR